MKNNNSIINQNSISLSTLIVMIITAIVTIRGLATEAEYGTSSAFYYIVGAIIFFIPTALVVAELTMMFQDTEGGVATWIGKALGMKYGLVSIWLQWIASMISFPALLIVGSVSIAYIGTDMASDSLLASNKIYTFIIIQSMYWIATIIALNGMKWISKVSKIGGLIGTIIPIVVLIVCAILFLIMGGDSQINFSHDYIPKISGINQLVLASCVFSFYSGMEIISAHIKDIKKPEQNFPKAFLIAAIVVILAYILGTFSIAIIVPQAKISLTQSVMMGFDHYAQFFNIPWASSILAVALAIGVFAMLLVYISGPSKSLFAMARLGFLPLFFQKTNKKGLPKNILIIQGCLFSILSILFLVMPTVQSFYQIVCQMSIILHLIMYLLLFISILVLRYKCTSVNRPFRIGKRGNLLAWIVSSLGIAGVLLAITLSFFPPQQITTGNHFTWFLIITIGTIVMVSIPFVVYKKRKSTWLHVDNNEE